MSEEKWHEKNLAWQMGNIGSEILRAKNREDKGDFTGRQNALERVLELLDFTLSDQKNRRRLKEAARLREVVACLYANCLDYNISLSDIKKYLLPFGILARK